MKFQMQRQIKRDLNNLIKTRLPHRVFYARLGDYLDYL
jgi:hypothetical protein